MDFRAGRCVYHCDKNTIEGELGRVNTYLYCCLPDGKILSYPFPMLTDATDNYGQPYDQLTYQMGVRSAVGELRNRKELYGGLLFQNAVQGVAARLLIRATETAMDAGLDVRLHVHDEILIVGGEREAAELQTIMLDVPPWAEGLPLATGDPMTATRWGK
jgi:DNA polymerase